MNPFTQRLAPPQGKGHVSVTRLPNHWYVACRSETLRTRPLRRLILGTPITLFRSIDGHIGALLDRCPHRNVRLSLGKVLPSGNLECCYHGWQFDTTGQCRHVPCLTDSKETPGRRVDAFPVVERDGLVWVFGTPNANPNTEPFALPLAAKSGYTTVIRELEVQASVHATAENALDVPHTAFLHRGLFRGSGRTNKINVDVRRWPDRVEAEYIGEPRPPGFAGRLLSPSGGMVEHWDRFFLPSITQVEYKLGTENHVLVTTALTPVEDFVTRIFAVISFRVRLPGWLIRPFLTPLAMGIFKQDARILEAQTAVIQEFGGEQFMSTDVDVLGREIWRLLNQAERPDVEPGGDGSVVRKLEIEV